MFFNLERFAQNIAVITEQNESFTYQKLADLADDFAKKLEQNESQEAHVLTDIVKSTNNTKKLVLIRSSNDIHSLIAYLGCLRHGHVALLLSNNVEDSLLTNLIETYSPDFIYQPCSEKNKHVALDYNLVASTDSYVLVKPKLNNDISSSSTNEIFSDLALLLSTSGSTGSPKLVRLSYKNLQSNAKSIAQYLELNSSERPITSLPFSYSYGLSVINSHLEVGATILLTDESVMQANFWQFFKEQKASSFAGVPYTYKMLKMLRFNKMDLPSLRYMTQAGGKLEHSLLEEFIELCHKQNKKFIVMYGQTEASPRMSYLPWAMALNKIDSIGIAIPQGHLVLENEQKQEVTTAYQEENLVYYGDNVALGYAQQKSDLALGDINQGRLETGEIAYFDDEHYFYIVGRRSRFIKLSGLRFNLKDCEDILEQHGYSCIVTGKDELLCIAVYSEHQELDSLKSLITNIFHLHSSFFVIKQINEQAIPRNEVGKVQYHRLMETVFS